MCGAHTNLLKNSMKPALLVELVEMSVWATSISLATQAQHAGVFWYIGHLIISLPWFLPQIQCLLYYTLGKSGVSVFFLQFPDKEIHPHTFNLLTY